MMALVYGGSGSGKSAFAEGLLAACAAPRLYVATMFPGDGEARERIARHRAARAEKGFVTAEVYTDLAGFAASEIPVGAAVLLECLGNVLANEMFLPGGAGAEGSPREAVLRGLAAILRRAARVVVVSNDVFSDGVAYPPETEEYIHALAELNLWIAARSALVVETVCGIPLRHKDDGGWGV